MSQLDLNTFYPPTSIPSETTNTAVPARLESVSPVEEGSLVEGGAQAAQGAGGEGSLTARDDTLSVKRNIGDLSLDSVDDESNLYKHPRVELDSPDLLGTFKQLIESMTADISAEISSNMGVINAKLDRIHADITSRIDSVETRMSAVEQADASRQLAVVDLSVNIENMLTTQEAFEARIAALENTSPANFDHVSTDWAPSGPTVTSIQLLGDSNSGGKLKFGSGRGTLGEALPGVNNYCPKMGDLPPPDSPAFADKTDVVLAVGTNDLKDPNCRPEIIIRKLHDYVKTLKRTHQSIHVHLPGVLPTSCTDNDINDKIVAYNHFLADMSQSLPRVSYIDVKVLQARGGSLVSKFSLGATDPFHLNDQGLRLYFSRIKHSLRLRHNLPIQYRRNPAVVGSATEGENNFRGRGGGRGRGNRGRGRGDRGRGRGGFDS